MRTIILTLFIAALAAFSMQSCVIGGDEPWDAEGSDTDTDTDTGGDGDGDTDSDSELYDNDAGPDGSVDAG